MACEREAMRRAPMKRSEVRLPDVWCIGDAPRAFAESVSDAVTVVAHTDAETIVEQIRKGQPRAVLFGSDAPWEDPAKTLKFLRSLSIDPEDLKKICGTNAAGLLGIWK